MKISLCEVVIEEIYTIEELMSASDWFVQEGDVGFCSTQDGMCVRFERDDIIKNKFVIKQWWISED